MKEASEDFDVPEVYLFSQNGKMRVTSSDFDHIDLNGEAPPRMGWTFRPLLYGVKSNASTSTTQKVLEESGEKKNNEAEESDSGAPGAGQGAGTDKTACAGAAGGSAGPQEGLYR